MNSRLYIGRLDHERVRPARNVFHYPLYYLGLDLDELEEVDRSLRWFSYNRGNLTSFWDRDHGPRDGSPLKPWIEGLVSRVGGDLSGGRVLLVTFPRVLGARFYPISLWYCWGADGAPLAVLAEVHNTYRDRHSYLMHNGGQPFDWNSKPRFAKAFFVSPFIQRENVTYEFSVTEPGERLRVGIRENVEGELMLIAGIVLHAEELTDRSLVRTVLKHGPISVVGLIRIHWQALKLVLKRVPLYPHTPPPDEEVSM